jgi:hypothetical protein
MAQHEPVRLEIEQDQLQEFPRDALDLGDLSDRERLVLAGETEHRSEGVTGLLRQHGGCSSVPGNQFL